MSTKKKLFFIGLGGVIVVIISIITVLLLRHFTVGQASPSKQSQSQTENADNSLNGAPVELRQEGLRLAEQGERDKALQYFNAAKQKFVQANDKAAIEEIDMQIDQARFIPDKDNAPPVYGGQSSDPGYISQ